MANCPICILLALFCSAAAIHGTWADEHGVEKQNRLTSPWKSMARLLATDRGDAGFEIGLGLMRRSPIKRSVRPRSATSMLADRADPQADRRSFSKRALLLPALAALTSGIVRPQQASAAELELTKFTDPKYGVTIDVPKEWKTFATEIPSGNDFVLPPSRHLVSSLDPNDKDVGIQLIFLGLYDNRNQPVLMSQIKELYSLDGAGGKVVPYCPDGLSIRKCTLQRDGYENEWYPDPFEGKQNFGSGYLFDYTTVAKGELKRHVIAYWTLVAPGKFKNQADAPGTLVTLSAQCPEEKFPALEATFRKVAKSLKV